MSENYTEHSINQAHLIEALQWHLDNGADDLLVNEPVDRTLMPVIPKAETSPVATHNKQGAQKPAVSFMRPEPETDLQAEMMGAAEAIQAAQKLAKTCNSLEDLSSAITNFQGLSVKKTASHMVFADGNAKAIIMLISEAPGADEDIQGKPFVGESGKLLDKILACIGLDRQSEDLAKSVYLTNVLNWRPPGNRTPTEAEMEISLAFIERHIALVQPKLLILCGGTGAKTLLRSTETISKLRGKFHEYKGADGALIPTMVTYHPSYLLRTPAQKKAVWADMLMLQDKLAQIG